MGATLHWAPIDAVGECHRLRCILIVLTASDIALLGGGNNCLPADLGLVLAETGSGEDRRFHT
jgi:hypothetical protein